MTWVEIKQLLDLGINTGQNAYTITTGKDIVQHGKGVGKAAIILVTIVVIVYLITRK
jgi:hypothetical protein